MSKSIEEMIAKYNKQFLYSEENEEFIFLSLIHSLKTSVSEFYTFSLRNGITIDDELYYENFNEILEYFKNLHIYSETMYEHWDKKRNPINNHTILHSFVYIYIQLNECVKMIYDLYLDNLDDNDTYEAVSLRANNILNAVDVVIDKLRPNINEHDSIEFVDLLVKTNIFKCINNHQLEQIKANIDIMDCNGTIVTKSFPAGYCKECNHFFVLEKDFERLKRYGVLLCRVVTEEMYRGISAFNISNLKAESVLHQVGYNVSSVDDLSTEQRREILRRVVDFGLYSISGLCSFLDYLIDKNLRVKSRDMSSAINKWQADRDYIANYNIENCRQVNAKSFYLTKYEYYNNDKSNI